VAVTSTVPDLRADSTGPPRLLAGWFETGRPADHADHRARYGPLPLEASGRAARAALIATVARAGLRGRGGGAFPTAQKLAAVADGRGPRVVVANGCEGDPASGKDRVLLELAPHLVLDGLVLAAAAVRAADAVLCIPATGLQVARFDAALAERAGDEPVAVRIAEVPERYVASEESALVRFLTTGDARPTVTPPRPAQRGVRGRPTLVDNVETLAHLALITRYGPEWYRVCGTAAAPGTALVTVGGAVWRAGVYEIEYGTPLGAVLGLAGGPAIPPRAVLVGGLGGAWLPFSAATDVPFTPEDLRAAGAIGGGVAALTVLPERACGLVETARALRYLAAESAGQCGPCMFGLPAVAADMAALAVGEGGQRRLTRLRDRLDVVRGRGACAHPDGAIALTASALAVFADDVARHAVGMPCAHASVPPWLPVPGPRP
jgi:NADH:ubiquinone oxidoreductase subunit F (NADH-binding)